MAPGPAPLWHFIGGLQTQQGPPGGATLVDLWESVDRPSLGAEVAKRAPGARVLAQVNISGEATKGGCPPEDTATLVAELRDLGLDVAWPDGCGRAG